MKHHLLKIKHPKYALSTLFVVIFFSILIVSCPHYNRGIILAPLNHASRFDTSGDWKKVVAGDGDSLDSIFYSLGIPRATLAAVMKLPQAQNELDPLHLDQTLYFQLNQHHLKTLRVPIDFKHTLWIENNNGKISAQIQTLPIDTVLVYGEGIVQHLFLEAAHQAGLSTAQAYQMADIYRPELDFSKMLHTGDRFEVLYQKYYLHGKEIGTGPVIAATFYVNHKTYSLIRFGDDENNARYYTPFGKSIEPALMRVPIHYTRISSYFSWHRYHPILHIYRPHLGVDLAAPSGTPVESVGNGRIIFIGKDGEAGNAIKVQYDEHYISLYAHLSRFAKKLHRNSSVKKGQVIGYVGETGLATGPHLHYGVYVNYVPKNPLTVKLPGTQPISAQDRPAFLEEAQAVLALLHLNAEGMEKD